MAANEPGGTLFAQRVEYPLPAKQGVRDYVFYFVPASDGYGKAAREFLKRFYPRHVHRDAISFEALITDLRSDVTANEVARIRELVLVAHGTVQGLVLPVVSNTSEINLREFRHTTPFSLAFLQQDFFEGKFAAFRQARAEVISRLDDESWVTLRACRVGSSADTMYALFSFFGGRANVYAPREFQFFGSHPVMTGMRVESTLDVHDHLVKQRFLPNDVHTVERQDAIVRALMDAGRFSQPFDLASVVVGDTTSAEAVTYDALVTTLDRLRIDDTLRSKFAAASHPLTRNAVVTVKARRSSWLVEDTATHQGVAAIVGYEVAEEIGTSGAERRATLRASARISSARSSREAFPLQLFFYESENHTWKGRLAVLAAYLEDPATTADKTAFDSLLSRFPQSSAPIAVPAEIAAVVSSQAGIELSPAATIRHQSATGTGPTRKVVWSIEGTTRYAVKLEHPFSNEGVPGHSLALYTGHEGADRLREEYDLMSYLGQDPDCPGPELAAYLDRFPIDSLVSVIDHLRSPYRAEHSYYIHHAQQAIRRKKEYFSWSSARLAGNTDPLGPLIDPYESLTGVEAEDKRLLAYDFDFDGIWQEVKASHRSLVAVQSDLYVEQNLWQKLGLGGIVTDRTIVSDLTAESPFTDLAELRALEAQGGEPFFATEKTTFDAARDDGADCKELAQILQRWKDLQVNPPDEVKRLLSLEIASDGKSFLDHLHWLYDKYKIGKIGLDLYGISFMKDGLAVKIASRIPVLGIPTASGVPTAFTAMLRVLPAITIPLTLWMKTLEAQVEARTVWKNTGKLTAVRQWLRELISLTLRDTLPEPIVIDLGSPGSTRPHIERYFKEQRDEYGMYSPFVFAPERMEEGFEDGVKLMADALDELLEQADDALDDLLRELAIDSCEAKVLVDVGLLDLAALRKQVIRQIADTLLSKLPKV